MNALERAWGSIEGSGRQPFVLIDCAGLEGGWSSIPESAFDRIECLFTGDLADELADVAPYLGRLAEFSKTNLELADDLMKRQVAILVATNPPSEANEDSFATLHRHFRAFNLVYGPTGQPLFFRFYDPRVLVDALSVLDREQLLAFFGRVDSFILLDQRQELLRCRCVNGELQTTRLT